jgi:hypothetical protein
MLESLHGQAAAAKRGNDPRGRRLSKTEGIADGDDEVADLQRIGIAEAHIGEIPGIDLEHGDIGARIRADQLRGKPPVVLQRYQHLARILHDVCVGHHVPVLRVHDDSGAGGDLRLRFARQTEETPEKWIAQHRVLLLRAALEDGDIHHRRRNSLENRR